MFRLWGKIVKKNNVVQSYVLEMHEEDMTFDQMLSKGIEDICIRFDIGIPLWLNDNTIEMNKINKTKFRSQHFIEEIDFDYFEIECIVDLE